MKKLIVLLAALSIAASASAQVGIIAGLTSPSSDVKEAVDNYSAIDQYHVGLTLKMPLFLGLAIQPSLVYSVKGATVADTLTGVDNSFDKTGNIELPIMVQWGLTIGDIARAFVFAEPYLSYMVDAETFNLQGEKLGSKDWDAYNRLQYGAGVGIGAEVLGHIQLSARYIWNMGNFLSEDGKTNFKWDTAFGTVKGGLEDKTNNGIRVSLAFLF